jgi:hypothetical protein
VIRTSLPQVQERLGCAIAKTANGNQQLWQEEIQKDLNAIDKDEEGKVKDDVSQGFRLRSVNNLSFTGDNDNASMRSVDMVAEEN